MSHLSSTDSSEPLRPSPILSVGASEERSTSAAGAGTTEESGPHNAHRFGFWMGEEAREAGIPVERRPLTRRSIRNWTIGSFVGTALFAAVVIVSHSRGATEGEGIIRVGTVVLDTVPVQAAAVAPAATMTPPAAVPLEALPIAREEGGPKAARPPAPRKTAAHKPVTAAHVRPAEKPSAAASAKSASRALVPVGTKTKASATTVTKASATTATTKNISR